MNVQSLPANGSMTKTLIIRPFDDTFVTVSAEVVLFQDLKEDYLTLRQQANVLVDSRLLHYIIYILRYGLHDLLIYDVNEHSVVTIYELCNTLFQIPPTQITDRLIHILFACYDVLRITGIDFHIPWNTQAILGKLTDKLPIGQEVTKVLLEFISGTPVGNLKTDYSDRSLSSSVREIISCFHETYPLKSHEFDKHRWTNFRGRSKIDLLIGLSVMYNSGFSFI